MPSSTDIRIRSLARWVRDVGWVALAQAAPWMVPHQVDVPGGAWGRTASPGQGPRAVDFASRSGSDVAVVMAAPLAVCGR